MSNKHMHLSMLPSLRRFNRSISDKQVTSLKRDYRVFDGEKLIIVSNISQKKMTYQIKLYDYVSLDIDEVYIYHNIKDVVSKLQEMVVTMQNKNNT
jgi:DNA-binding cell septation regulator SpoVG